MNIKKMRNQLVGFSALGQIGFIPEPVGESLEDDKLRVYSGAKERPVQDRGTT